MAAQEAERAKFVVEKAEQDKRSAVIRAQVRRIYKCFRCYCFGSYCCKFCFTVWLIHERKNVHEQFASWVLYHHSVLGSS